MRRLFILCALLAIMGMTHAQGTQALKAMQAKGLPTNAIPAKYYFQHQFESPEALRQFGEGSLDESSIVVPDAQGQGGEATIFFFIVPQPVKADQDFGYVDLWIFDDATQRARRIFHQDLNNYGEHMVLDIHMMGDVNVRDSVYTDKKTRQRITRHLRTGYPVAALQVQLYNGTGHGIISTLLVDGRTGNTQLLEHQTPVKVLYPLTNMLMLAEWNMAQSYLITTGSAVNSDDPYQPTEDFDIFSHMNFTPILYIYTPKGQLLKTIELPTECIDMVR